MRHKFLILFFAFCILITFGTDTFAGIRNRNVEKKAEIDIGKINLEADPNEHRAASDGKNQYLQLPTVSNANQITPSAAENGGLYYDSTDNKLYGVINGSATDLGGAASTESLNQAYDEGANIDIDAAGGDLEIDYAATGSVMILDADTNSVTVTDCIKAATTGSSSVITDFIDASDAGIVNALNVGANVIIGTGGASINFDEFDVATGTGSVTINDDGDLGAFTVEGTLLDINSLDFIAAGQIYSTDGGNALTLAAGDGGDAGEDLIITAHNVQLTAGGAITMSPDGAVTTALTITDTDYTNALSVGDNAILGTTGIINYDNFDVAADGSVVIGGDLTVSGTTSVGLGTWEVNVVKAATTNQTITIDGDGSGGVTIGGVSTGGITLVRNVALTGDLDIDGNDITSAADLVITPGGGNVDFNVANIAVDTGKKIGLNSITGLSNDFIILTGSNVVIDAAADIVLDAGGGDVDVDAADVLIDSGNKLSVNGATKTATFYLSTDLKIDSPTDVVISPTGGDVDFTACDVQLDATKKLSLNADTETDVIYSDTDLQIKSAADVIITPTGAQVGIIAADLCVATGKKVGLNSIAGLANDYLSLSTDVTLDAAADIILAAGGGQVAVSAADLGVDAAKYISLAGIATIDEASLIYQNSAIEVFVNQVNVADFTATGFDVIGALSASTTITATGNINANGDIVGDGATKLTGVVHTVASKTSAHSVTIAESGTVFDNTGSSGTIIFTLPEGSTAIGAEYTFVVTAAFGLNINPNDGTDQFISPITNAAGDSIQSSTAGDSVTIICIGNDTWVIKAAYPAASDWVDTN